MKTLNIIANPENRRVGLLQKALENLNLPRATVISYADLITGKQNLEQFNSPDNIIRFDSPEKNFEVDKAIIAVGEELEGGEGEEEGEGVEINNYQGCGFDLRVVVINGEAQHTVVRLGKSPMTNLHLGNERGDIKEFLDKVSDSNWEKMKRTCEQAASLFPNSLYCGVDLMILPDWEQHAVLEINAFGGLLPGITHRGLDTYESELKAVFDK